MIELNLTYEESKKILESGYDFRNIATDFVTKINQTKLKRVNDTIAIDINIDTSDINDFPHDLPDYFYFIESSNIIPLIPKAALEACLPRNLNPYPFSSHLVRTLEKLGYRRNGKEYSYINFDSALEAFLWLHEKYPDELKAKFDEVMA